MAAPTIDATEAGHGEPEYDPAEVRAAVAACGNDLTVTTFDQEMARARAEGPEALRRFLGYWRTVAAQARGDVPPPARERRMSREQFIAAWEERSGRRFPTAA